MIKQLNRETLSTILQGPLPGQAGQRKLAPDLRVGERARGRVGERESGRKGERESGRTSEEESQCRSAAVLILLYPDGDHIHTVFMKRNEYDGPHSGQISFPGGMYEDRDLDLEQTAIRETEEEIGIHAGTMEVLGRLTPLFIPISNFCVTPYVAWMTERPEFHPDSSEVQYLLTPSLDELLDPAYRRKEVLHRHGRDILTPYILLDEDILWGATAMILSEFMELIEG